MDSEEIKAYGREVEKVIAETPIESRDDLIRTISDVIKRQMFASNDEGSKTACPFCGSLNRRKYGLNSAGTQRFQCKDCEHVFVNKPTGSIIFFTKLPFEKWQEFAECFVDGLSCARIAEKIEVTPRTAWFMRIRTLEALKENLPSFEIKAGCGAHIDGIYFSESFKGVSFKELGEMPRAPKDGETKDKRGISNDKICVITAVNDSGDFFYELACRGAMTTEIATSILENMVCEGAIINTDKHKAYRQALSDLKVAAHNAFDSTDHEAMKPIDSIHSAIRGFMRRFNGVSTKWLDLYLAYFKWIRNFAREDNRPGAISSKQIYNGDYQHRWNSINKMPLPFRDANLQPTKLC